MTNLININELINNVCCNNNVTKCLGMHEKENGRNCKSKEKYGGLDPVLAIQPNVTIYNVTYDWQLLNKIHLVIGPNRQWSTAWLCC